MRGRARIGAWLAPLLCVAVAGCSSSGPTALERIGAVAQSAVVGAEEQATPRLTRAQLNEIPYATIAVSTEGRPRSYLVPLSDNGGYLNYRDADGNAVVLFGGAISGTESLGHDLQAVRHHRLDPIAHQTPLARWPGRVQRDYRYARRDLSTYRVTLDCLFTAARPERIEIVELAYDLVRVDETCTNAERQVENIYWVDPATGFIWKSEQWIGPEIGHATVEIIRPYDG